MADPAAPYPSELERHARLADGTPIFLRPIRPGDWRLLQWGFRRVIALLQQDNLGMRRLAGSLGFTLAPMPDEPALLRAEKVL